ncbi:class I SAM-dependent methyltransferase [Luteibacter sp. E-22]|uniref:class I SAM-dependent methyltransferase n=1 Tax=Luteibacter sp. E-22 TaxID=3404050 RepID=UPI003CE6D35F
MNDGLERQGHATLDLGSRVAKARKIERLLDLPSSHQKILEVGTGAGGIAHYFAVHAGVPRTVEAVDVKDQRQVKEGYGFTVVSSTTLPFPEATFDAVISNHVIEHVGDREGQLHHLMEIARVLKAEGCAYLAVPSRWMLIEPHYGLPFLSWLPRGWRSAYLRLAKRGHHYDCEPLQLYELEDLVRKAGLICENVSLRAFRTLIELERPSGLLARLARLPDPWLEWLNPLAPTHVCLLRRDSRH